MWKSLRTTLKNDLKFKRPLLQFNHYIYSNIIMRNQNDETYEKFKSITH